MGTKEGLAALARELDAIQKLADDNNLEWDEAETLYEIQWLQQDLDIDEELAHEVRELQLSGSWTKEKQDELLKKKQK